MDKYYDINIPGTWLFIYVTLQGKLAELKKKQLELEEAQAVACKAMCEGEDNPNISDEEMDRLYDAYDALEKQGKNLSYQVEAAEEAIEQGFKFIENLEYLQGEGVLPDPDAWPPRQ